ncbi:c-type cytochrome [Opitutales bacterium]|nr:c-type cytochrome [Opitutales bacterium]
MTNLSSINLFLALLVALLMPKLTSASNFDFPADPELVVNKSTGLSVPKGFETDLVYKVDRAKYGSWISMTFDHKGRLVVSDQDNAGTFLIELPEIGKTLSESGITKLPLNSGQWGMLYAFDHLYMVSQKRVVRVPVSESGEYGKEEELFRLSGGWEHGPHSLIVTEDGKGLYFVAGNFARNPPFETSRIRTNWKDDVLLENYAYGHNGTGKAPGGWVIRLNPDGTNRELINMGYRNPCDFALNRDGEMFVYDADMEWDMGAPWYRPTRVNHGVSGGENGWRATSKKWRKYFPDTVGSVVDIGPGCPVGVIAGTNANFPTRYRDAIFLCDWTFATMYAMHLKPDGSSYKGKIDTFVTNINGSLALTDVDIGPDGHMYFCVGGRKGQSYLYRVRYTGDQSTELSPLDTSSKHYQARKTRHSLESFHGAPNPKAIESVWSYLSSEDYHLRYAARIAIEWQDPKTWAGKAYNETNDIAAIHSLLGLARCDFDGSKQPSIDRLLKVDFNKLDKTGKLALLRTYSVIMSRAGKATEKQIIALGKQLDPHYPTTDDNLNEELCRVLCYLQHPSVVSKTIDLMKTTKISVPKYDPEMIKRGGHYGKTILAAMSENVAPNVLNIHFLFCLKDVTNGWSMDQRKAYLGELKELLSKKGGNYFSGYLNKIRESAIANVPDEDKLALQYLTGEIKDIDLSKLPRAKGPGVAWTVDSGLEVLNKETLKGRNFANGKKMYSAGLCVACHRFGDEGGGVGPDLTNLAKRMDYKAILESTIHPNMVVSNQFEQHELTMKDGSLMIGKIVSEEDGYYSLVQSGLQPLTLTKVEKSKVASKKGSKISMMPGGLINSMNAEELKDLFAYFVSTGDRKHKIFRPIKKLAIEIVRAVYGQEGNPKKQMDLKSALQKKVDSMSYEFEMTNQLAGKDPAGGVVKTLDLEYKVDGKTIKKKIRENQLVSFVN